MGSRVQHTYAYRRLCGFLRKWRLAAELSQRQLGKKLRKPASFVHKCEVGDRRIDPVEFIAWCKACRQNPSRALAELDRSGR
jgi:predicted transcriptional regulator